MKIRDDDLAAVMECDPCVKDKEQAIEFHMALHVVSMYRESHELWLQGKKEEALRINYECHSKCGADIHPGATIGNSFFIDHATGIVIGETAEIGDNCTLYQGVTLGGTGKDTGKRHPTLGNNVMVGAGAKVLGPFRIGDNSKIAAGAVVLSEIPSNATAVGIPARVVRRDGVRVMSCEEELDQVHLPDPVAQQLCRLEARCARLEAELAELHAARENAENERRWEAEIRARQGAGSRR